MCLLIFDYIDAHSITQYRNLHYLIDVDIELQIDAWSNYFPLTVTKYLAIMVFQIIFKHLVIIYSCLL